MTPDSHPPAAIAALLLVSAVGGLAKGLTGFGGALVMAPLFSLIVPSTEASALIVLVHCASSLQGMRDWAPQARWQVITPFALVAIASASVISQWLAPGHADAIRRLVGACVLATTVLHIKGWHWRHKGHWSSTLLAGLVSGAMTACGGLGGPAAVYYLNGLSGGNLRASLLGYFALLFGGVTLLMLLSHPATPDRLALAVPLTLAFAAGTLLGDHLQRRLPSTAFKHLVCALLLASGTLALLA